MSNKQLELTKTSSRFILKNLETKLLKSGIVEFIKPWLNVHVIIMFPKTILSVGSKG